MPPADDYHADYTAVSKSMLSVFRRSRREYYLTYVTRELSPEQLDSERVLIGTICHGMLLEHRPLDSLAAIYPESCYAVDGRLNGKAAQKFRDDHPEHHCIRAHVAEQILSICEHFAESDFAYLLTNGWAYEQRFDATIHGVPCKAKPDILFLERGYDEDVMQIWDLKFSDDITPASFYSSAKSFLYWLQHAHYCAVVAEALDRNVVSFKFLAVETVFPFRVQPYWYHWQSAQLAREVHADLLRQLARCHETGRWCDEWPNEICPPDWSIERPGAV